MSIVCNKETENILDIYNTLDFASLAVAADGFLLAGFAASDSFVCFLGIVLSPSVCPAADPGFGMLFLEAGLDEDDP